MCHKLGLAILFSDELQQSAREHQNRGMLALQGVCVLVGLMFLSMAYSTAKKGFQVTGQGAPAWLLAGLFAVVGIGIAVGGVLYADRLLP